MSALHLVIDVLVAGLVVVGLWATSRLKKATSGSDAHAPQHESGH